MKAEDGSGHEVARPLELSEPRACGLGEHFATPFGDRCECGTLPAVPYAGLCHAGYGCCGYHYFAPGAAECECAGFAAALGA